jgi:nitrite reductase/ring-hydroxylating ferredoxin subunit
MGKLVDGCRIQCPIHRARFDVRTGETRFTAGISRKR